MMKKVAYAVLLAVLPMTGCSKKLKSFVPDGWNSYGDEPRVANTLSRLDSQVLRLNAEMDWVESQMPSYAQDCDGEGCSSGSAQLKQPKVSKHKETKSAGGIGYGGPPHPLSWYGINGAVPERHLTPLEGVERIGYGDLIFKDGTCHVEKTVVTHCVLNPGGSYEGMLTVLWHALQQPEQLDYE